MFKVQSRYRSQLLLSIVGFLSLMLVMSVQPNEREVKTNMLFQVRSYLLA